jgi:hypothetical protein
MSPPEKAPHPGAAGRPETAPHAQRQAHPDRRLKVIHRVSLRVRNRLTLKSDRHSSKPTVSSRRLVATCYEPRLRRGALPLIVGAPSCRVGSGVVPAAIARDYGPCPALRSKLKMCRARVIASSSFPLLPGHLDRLRDRSRIAASASSIRCNNLPRSNSRTAAR